MSKIRFAALSTISTAWCSAVVAIVVILSGSISETASAQTDVDGPIVSAPVIPHSFDGNVTSLPQTDPFMFEGVELTPRLEDPLAVVPGLSVPQLDPLFQESTDGATLEALRALDQLLDPIVNTDGIRTGANPHDPVGDIGPNHYVEMINSSFAIYLRNPDGGIPNAPVTAANINTLWTGAGVTGTDCSDNNAGDPIVLYDRLADRWMLSQFAGRPRTTLCIAISQTPDPTGAYHLYEFDVGEFPDYPKYGVWPDGYYVSANFSSGNSLVGVFDRANMLNGNPAAQVNFTVSGTGVGFDVFMPSDFDGPTAPPAGTPNFFYRQVDGDAFGGNDRIEIWEFAANWLNPLTSTFTGPTNINLAAFDAATCGFNSFSCVPQPGNATRCPVCDGPSNNKLCNGGTLDDLTCEVLDPVNEPPMHRFPYRNFGTHESLVGNFTVDVNGSDGHGIRWFELRRSGGGGWTLQQEGSYSPQPADATSFVHRWMGSIAIDQFGNIALGYNVSNATDIFPSIRYTGRLAGDPPSLLPQGEKTIIAGGSQMRHWRWGDYSSMNVDPRDDCTFWYINDYVTAGGLRQPRIASFRFADCALDLSIEKLDSPDPVLAGEQLTYNITVSNNGPLDATNVVVTDTLPLGVSFVSDSLAAPECNDTTEPTIVCNLGDLAAGDSTSFSITVTVDSDILFVPNAPIEIQNTAVVEADQNDSDDSNDEVTEVTLVNELADLAVTKVCKPDDPALGGTTATCEIFVDNFGLSGARNVTLTDVHVSEGAFTIGTITASQGSCNGPPPAGTVDCDIGDIDAGERVTVTVAITSDDPVDVNNVATVSSDTPDPDPTNNQDQGSLSFIGLANLSMTKTDTPDPVTAGETITYDFTVSNAGPSSAINVVISDNLPAGVSVISLSSSGGTCNAGVPGDAAQPTICTFDSLAASASASMQVVVLVDPSVPAGTILHNSAAVSSDTLDNDNSDNLATTNTTVAASADLMITKSDAPDPVVAGSILDYTVSVSNAGPSTARDVEIVDTLPGGTSLVSASVLVGSGVCLETAPGVVTCTSATDLDPGDTFTVVIKVLVDASVPHGTTLNNMAVTSSSTPDPVPANNTTDQDTAVVAEAELWIDKTGNFPTGNPSSTIIFFLSVHNDAGCSVDDPEVCGTGGPSDAQNVVVTDTLPTTGKKKEPVEIVFVSEDCVDNGNLTVTCTTPTLPAGQTVQHEIHIQVSGKVEELENIASVTSDTTDPNAGNNTDTLLMVVKGGSDRPGGPGGGRGKGPK